MSKAWVTQPSAKLKQLGPDECPWVCEWYDPAGGRRRKTFGPGDRGKKLAERFCAKVSAELLTGTYQDRTKASWADVADAYRRDRYPHLSADTRRLTQNALKHFARVTGLKRAAALAAAAAARYAAKRLTERRRKGTTAPATVNLELRHLKAVFAFAAEHKYVPAAPKVWMCREPKRLPRVVTPDRLTALMDACEAATLPAGLPDISPAAWWRGLFGFLYMTGWRIGETLRLGWAETDLDALQVVTLAGTNKANRDDRIPLHPAAAALLVPLRGGAAAEVFPWPHHRRTLDAECVAIQTAAGVTAPFHGFHDFRRSFATFNANGLGAETLKRMMRHQGYATTKKYIRVAEDLSPVIGKLFVPDALKPPAPPAKKGRRKKGG